MQLKCQRMCEWNRYAAESNERLDQGMESSSRGFPGSQPISMDKTNYETIVQSPYMVSWKADGTR